MNLLLKMLVDANLDALSHEPWRRFSASAFFHLWKASHSIQGFSLFPNSAFASGNSTLKETLKLKPLSFPGATASERLFGLCFRLLYQVKEWGSLPSRGKSQTRFFLCFLCFSILKYLSFCILGGDFCWENFLTKKTLKNPHFLAPIFPKAKIFFCIFA